MVVFKARKFILMVLVALLVALVLFFLRTRAVQTNRESVEMERGDQSVDKTKPTVLATKDKDGYGLAILARDFRGVRKVEMVVGYNYKGRENPTLVASGAPQQNSYWAHFRFESCSRNDCVYYKTDRANFRLTLNYEDGESREYEKEIILASISKETPVGF